MKKFCLLPLLPLLLLLLALTTGCSSNSNPTSPSGAGRPPGGLRAALDTIVAPGQDFFTYANGT